MRVREHRWHAPEVSHLTGHALKQMKRRHISLMEVEEALASPETSYPSREYPDDRVVVLGSTSGGRRLKIVVLADDNEFVVTVADRDTEE